MQKGNAETRTTPVRAETAGAGIPSSAERIAAVDTGRGLAILMIVTAHVLRKGEAADFLMSTGVALFIFLSGYVMRRKGTFLQRAKKRIRRIYLPYLLVGLVSILLYAVLGSYAGKLLKTDAKEMETGILQNIGYLLYANSKNHHSMKWNETLWFLPCFLVTLLLSFGIEALVRRAAGGGREQGAKRKGAESRSVQNLLRLALSLIVLFIGWILVSRYDLRLPWQGETACHMLPFLELGIALGERDRENGSAEGKTAGKAGKEGKHREAGNGKEKQEKTEEEEKRAQRKMNCILSLLLLAAAVLLAIPFGESSIRTDEYPAGILSYLAILVSVLAFWGIAEYLPAWKWLMTFGERSLGIMLWNKFPVVAVQAFSKRIGIAECFLEKSTVPAVLAAFLLGIVCIALCLIWTGIPAWRKRKRAGAKERKT